MLDQLGTVVIGSVLTVSVLVAATVVVGLVWVQDWRTRRRHQ